MGVHELGKGTYEPCGHLCASGCGIYPDRPGSCRTFVCEWLRGVMEVDGALDTGLRPDACGVIFDYDPGSDLGERFTAWEVWPGASAVSPAREVLEGLSENFPVAVVTRAGPGPAAILRRWVGPPHLVRRATEPPSVGSS
jgi:hypothetical protein